MTGWWIRSGDYVIWTLREVLCLKIGELNKGKGERTECKKYRGISLLSVVEQIYVKILVDRVRRVTGSLIDDEKGGFRAGRGFVDQISH